MITDDIICQIGHTLKPHGINGEINAVVDSDVDLDKLSCLIMNIDGINVPFFLESWRSRGSEAVLLKFDHINNETEAEKYCGLELRALTAEIPDLQHEPGDEGFYAEDLIGWTILDGGKKLGVVSDFDDSTENLLLQLRLENDRTIYIPLANDLIIDINPDLQQLDMDLPSGLTEM